MKILLVNNFYYNRGGDCTYLFSLKELLERKGHKVIVFSMNHPSNFESEYSKYFVSYINYAEEVKNTNLSSGLKVLFRSIYSREAKKNLDQLITQENPDIAHVQNIHHHITPSIFQCLKKHGVPIIWTLHDYSLICPNTSFLSQGRICERCKKKKYFWPLIEKCKKNSFAASGMVALEATAHNLINIHNLVDYFITPSDFLRNKLLEYGFPKGKIININNFIEMSYSNGFNTGDYCLYLGRISAEKGLRTLIDAIGKSNTINLKIVGDGPLKDELIYYTRSNNLNNKIDFLGHKSRDQVTEFLKLSKFLVVPSECYENFPYSILEAFAYSKPVIGSRIGGIPELIKDNETGLTFEPRNTDELTSKIEYLINNPGKIVEMGQNARTFTEQELNADKHYNQLVEIYERALIRN